MSARIYIAARHRVQGLTDKGYIQGQSIHKTSVKKNTIMEKEFSRVRSAQDITISLILIICGGVLVALPTSTSVNIIGFFMIFAGIILVLTLKTSYKLVETGEKFKKKEKFFAQSKKDSLSAALAGNPDTIDIAEENKGNGLRIDVYYSTKLGKAYCRLYEYIPYRYEPCTPFYEHPAGKVEKLIK